MASARRQKFGWAEEKAQTSTPIPAHVQQESVTAGATIKMTLSKLGSMLRGVGKIERTGPYQKLAQEASTPEQRSRKEGMGRKPRGSKVFPVPVKQLPTALLTPSSSSSTVSKIPRPHPRQLTNAQRSTAPPSTSGAPQSGQRRNVVPQPVAQESQHPAKRALTFCAPLVREGEHPRGAAGRKEPGEKEAQHAATTGEPEATPFDLQAGQSGSNSRAVFPPHGRTPSASLRSPPACSPPRRSVLSLSKSGLLPPSQPTKGALLLSPHPSPAQTKWQSAGARSFQQKDTPAKPLVAVNSASRARGIKGTPVAGATRPAERQATPADTAATREKRLWAEVARIEGRAREEVKALEEVREREARALRHARDAAVVEAEKAHVEAHKGAALYEELLSRYKDLQNMAEAAKEDLRAQIETKSIALIRAKEAEADTACKLEQLKLRNEALQAELKARPPGPPSPSSTLETEDQEATPKGAFSDDSSLVRDIARCRTDLAAQQQERAALAAQLAQIGAEHAELLQLADKALRDLEAERGAAAAQKQQLEELARAAAVNATAAMAAEAKALEAQHASAVSSALVADLNAQIKSVHSAQAAAAAAHEAAREAAAARESALREDAAKLEQKVARLEVDIVAVKEDQRAQTQEYLEETRQREMLAMRQVAERESALDVAKKQIVKLDGQLAAAHAKLKANLGPTVQKAVAEQQEIAKLRRRVDQLQVAADAAAIAEAGERLEQERRTESERERAEHLLGLLRAKEAEVERLTQERNRLTLFVASTATEREKSASDMLHALTGQMNMAKHQIDQTIASIQDHLRSTTAASFAFLQDELERLRSMLHGAAAAAIPSPLSDAAAQAAPPADPEPNKESGSADGGAS